VQQQTPLIIHDALHAILDFILIKDQEIVLLAQILILPVPLVTALVIVQHAEGV